MKATSLSNLSAEKENLRIHFVREPFLVIFTVKKKIWNFFCVRPIFCNFFAEKEKLEINYVEEPFFVIFTVKKKIGNRSCGKDFFVIFTGEKNPEISFV